MHTATERWAAKSEILIIIKRSMKNVILRSSTLLTLGLLVQLARPVLAATPDATKDYIDATFTYNLGPTGARGWI